MVAMSEDEPIEDYLANVPPVATYNSRGRFDELAERERQAEALFKFNDELRAERDEVLLRAANHREERNALQVALATAEAERDALLAVIESHDGPGYKAEMAALRFSEREWRDKAQDKILEVDILEAQVDYWHLKADKWADENNDMLALLVQVRELLDTYMLEFHDAQTEDTFSLELSRVLAKARGET